MRLLDRYIAKQVAVGIAVVTLVVLGLDLLFRGMEAFNQIDDRYPLADAALVVLLATPSGFYTYLPLSCLIGSLVGLGALASHSELTVIRAAGVSLFQLFLSVIKPVFVLMLVLVAVGEWVVPVSEQKAKEIKAIAHSGSEESASLASGFWHREQDEFVRINAVGTAGALIGVSIYRFEEDRLRELSYAERASYDAGDQQWVMSRVKRTKIYDDHTEVERSDAAIWHSELTPTLLKVVTVDPLDLPATGLYEYVQYLERQSLESTEYRFAFWQKVLMPLQVLVLVLLGISFIVGPLRSVTLGQRLIVGVMVGLGFKLLQQLLGPASVVYGLPPLLAVSGPLMVGAGVGIWLLRRAG